MRKSILFNVCLFWYLLHVSASTSVKDWTLPSKALDLSKPIVLDQYNDIKGTQPLFLEMDLALEEVLCTVLSLPRRQLSPKDLSALPNTLDLSYYNITSLQGLEFADSVRTLNIAHNYITDIMPLLGMDSLRAVSIAYNPINVLDTAQQAVVKTLKSSFAFVFCGEDLLHTGPEIHTIRFENNKAKTYILYVQKGEYYRGIMTANTASPSYDANTKNKAWFEGWRNANNARQLFSFVDMALGEDGRTDDIFLAEEDTVAVVYRADTNVHLQKMTTKYLHPKAPTEDPRYYNYLYYLDHHQEEPSIHNLYDSVYDNVSLGLYFTDARDWYKETLTYLTALLSHYNVKRPSRENAKDAFDIRCEIRTQARALMGNKLVAQYLLPNRHETFESFFEYTKGKLLSKRKTKEDVFNTKVYVEIIESAQKSNMKYDWAARVFDVVLKFLRRFRWVSDATNIRIEEL